MNARSGSAVLTLAVLLPVLGGCAPERTMVRAPSNAPVDVPSDWATSPGLPTAVPTDWWREFGETPLDALLTEALLRNPDLAVTAARLSASEAVATIIGADRMPRVEAGGSRLRDKRVFTGLPIPGTADQSTISTTYGLSLDVSWELDLWGRLAAAEQAALADVAASEADFVGARLSLIAATVKAWLGLVEARLQVELATDNLANWTGNRELVERRYQAGLRSAVDLRILRASEAAARDRLEIRRFAYAEAARAIDVLIGRYPSAELEGATELPVLTELAPPGLPTQLLSRRPDLAAAERRLAAAELRIEEARAEFYPRLALTGSYGRTSSHFDDLLDGDFESWSVFGGVVQPIFEGGRLRAQVELADAESAAAMADFTATLLDAFAEVESALDAERRLAGREDALRVAAVEARGASDLSRRRYAQGVLDVITFFETERGAQQGEIDLLTVRRQRLEARVNLYLALGGGFEAPEPEVMADARDEP